MQSLLLNMVFFIKICFLKFVLKTVRVSFCFFIWVFSLERWRYTGKKRKRGAICFLSGTSIHSGKLRYLFEVMDLICLPPNFSHTGCNYLSVTQRALLASGYWHFIGISLNVNGILFTDFLLNITDFFTDMQCVIARILYYPSVTFEATKHVNQLSMIDYQEFYETLSG